MIPTPITSAELKEEIEEELGAGIYEADINAEAPYSISLPLSDWRGIYERLRFLEILDEHEGWL